MKFVNMCVFMIHDSCCRYNWIWRSGKESADQKEVKENVIFVRTSVRLQYLNRISSLNPGRLIIVEKITDQEISIQLIFLSNIYICAATADFL